MDARALSARIVATVLEKKTHLDQVLSANAGHIKDAREKALIQELCYGTLRWYFRLDAILSRLVNKPLKSKDLDIKALLLCGLYQLLFLRTPDHAAVSATVEATKTLNKSWATQLVNAVLRRFLREREAMEQEILESPVPCYAHPDWFIARVKNQWPEFWQTILETNNQYPPLHLRVNRLRETRDGYINRLRDSGINASPARFAESGILVHEPVPAETLPGFASGHITIQDFGAQLVTTLLNPSKGMRVLDACAAPGGKTGHIIEICPEITELVAVESDINRVKLLENTQSRLGFAATIINADVTQPDVWWDGQLFDRILIDAPCSASGVVQRHPDIKYIRTPEQIAKLLPVQQCMLESLWPLLKSGGILLYITCSVFTEENDEQIKMFCNHHENVKISPVAVDWGLPTRYGRQTLPGHDEAGGFYCSILMKTSSQ